MLEERTEAGVEGEFEDHTGSAKVHPPSHQIQSTHLQNSTAVDELLHAAQMRDEGNMTKTEELKLNHLYVELRVIDSIQERCQSFDVAKRTGKSDAYAFIAIP
ncbi:hypothetical protein JB92DRAFT_3138268 [Gautieria morchelliformis]|nr:hypothetical protein JB92DRAFT_3138268 [Gautieria morchelliformis]